MMVVQLQCGGSNAFISRVFLCQVLDVQSLIFPVAPGQMLSHFTANENWQ